MRVDRLVFGLIIGISLFSPASAAEAPAYVPGRLLIGARRGTDAGAVSHVLALHRAVVRQRAERSGISVVELPEESSGAAMESLRKTGLFAYVERDYYAHTAAAPSDPSYALQWHLPAIHSPQAWDLTTGSASIVVAVIDSGVDAGHPDLGSKLVPGWSFLTNTPATPDVLGHGTAVAGTIAAAANNGTGGAGVSWGSTIMPLAVVDVNDFAAYSDIASAIRYAADHGARIVNVSLGGPNASAALQGAVDYAWSKGAIVFAAAMNAGSTTPYYPAACARAVAVGATDSGGRLASYSNYGSWITLTAPGSSIFAPSIGGGYGYWYGTSFAAPVAAGVAALSLSANPALTNSALVQLLEQNADDLGDTGFDSSFGWGQVNAYRTVLAAQRQAISVSVGPATAVLGPGQTAQFSAAVANAAVAVGWSINPAVGAISSSGLYTAPASIGSKQTVTVTAAVWGVSASAAVTLVPPPATAPVPPPAAAPAFTPVRVNAGGPAYVDRQGQAWSADYGFNSGSAWGTQHAIYGTADPALYQTQRWGAFSYRFAVPNGSYLVALKFSETSQLGVGQRVFNVTINGAPALTAFDIFAEAGGGFLPIDKSFPVSATNGIIEIAFAAGATNWAEVNGIEILAASVFPPIRVNGGGNDYTDGAGRLWKADYGFNGGSAWGTAHAISSTPDAALYQTQRWGGFSYRFAVPNGSYLATLKFAEISQLGVGQRVFDVSINGAQALTAFDIFAQAGGGFLPIEKTFSVRVSGGAIEIVFAPGAANWPEVNAIEIAADPGTPVLSTPRLVPGLTRGRAPGRPVQLRRE